MATIKQRGPGKYQAQVRRVGFKPQTRTFPNRVAAEKWAREIESGFDRGVEVDISALRARTVADLLEKFRDEESSLRKGGRWEVIRIDYLIRTADWTHHRLDHPLSTPIRVWSQKRLKSVSAATVNRDLNLLSGIFRTAIKKWGVPLATNPIHSVIRPTVDLHGRGKVWTEEELTRLREHARSEEGVASAYVVPALELSIETAMRLGEICSVVAENVHVDQSFLVLETSKNGDPRKVPLSVRAIEILKPLVAAAQAREDDSRVFPVDKATLGLRFREARNLAGLDLRFHDGRHTAATRASKKLTNVLELAAFTGHRSLASLKRYYHADATDLAKKLG